MAPSGSVLYKLRNKYRLQLLDEAASRLRFSMRLSRMNVILRPARVHPARTPLILALIVLTPMKEFIPGYSDQRVKLNAYRATQKADSLAEVVAVQERYTSGT